VPQVERVGEIDAKIIHSDANSRLSYPVDNCEVEKLPARLSLIHHHRLSSFFWSRIEGSQDPMMEIASKTPLPSTEVS
jgi:hypothetical protein